MFRLFGRKKALVFFVCIVLCGYAAYRLVSASRNGVPADFSASRARGALIAENIVNGSNELTSDLQKVNEFAAQRDYTNALALTTEVARKSDDIRNQAAELSGELANMAKAVASAPINSADAREVALQSISNRLALINQLMNYSNGIGNLASALRDRFTNTPDKWNISQIIRDINASITAVNGFNSDASAAMERFDALINK